MKISFCLFLRVCFIHGTYSCYYGGGGGGEVSTTPDPDNPVPPADDDPGHWQLPSDGLPDFNQIHGDEEKIRQEEYAKWLNETSSAEKLKPKDEARDWPAQWMNQGPPNKGQPLPKWAIIKGGAGKPDLCYEPPLRGKCTRYVYRFGHNPYTGRCERYIFGGCDDGSDNNFYTMRRCNEVCVLPEKLCRKCKAPPEQPHFEEWEDQPQIPDKKRT